jgi:hypothetical protein
MTKAAHNEAAITNKVRAELSSRFAHSWRTMQRTHCAAYIRDLVARLRAARAIVAAEDEELRKLWSAEV